MRGTFDKDYPHAYESQEDKDKHLYQMQCNLNTRTNARKDKKWDRRNVTWNVIRMVIRDLVFSLSL